MNQNQIDAIKPLITSLNIQGRSVSIVFECPVTGKQYNAKHYQQQDRSFQGQALKSVKRSAMFAIQNVLSEVIRNIFGHNTISRAAGNVTRQTMYSATNHVQNSLSSSEKDSAILASFQTVASNFIWDQNTNRWVSTQGMQETTSAFAKQQQQYPVQHPYDLQVLSRMLVEVAKADGAIKQQERDWLISLLQPADGSLESLTNRPPLSPSELNQVSSGKVRETLLLLAWALALCDEEFAVNEKQLLVSFGQSFRLTEQQIGNIESIAQQYILENALEYMLSWGKQDQFSRQHLLQIASKIGVSQREALEVEAKYLRRKA